MYPFSGKEILQLRQSGINSCDVTQQRFRADPGFLKEDFDGRQPSPDITGKKQEMEDDENTAPGIIWGRFYLSC